MLTNIAPSRIPTLRQMTLFSSLITIAAGLIAVGYAFAAFQHALAHLFF